MIPISASSDKTRPGSIERLGIQFLKERYNMKKLISLLLAVLLGMTPVLSLAEDADAAKIKLLNRWMEYLTIQNQMLHDDLLVCDALITLEKSRTWEDMLRARAVVAAATLSRLELSEQSLGEALTSTEIISLITLGVDVDPFVMTMETLNADLEADMAALRQLSTTLLDNSLDTGSLSWTLQWAELKKNNVGNDAVWLCLMTNHLLNTLADKELAASFWAQMDKMYPVIVGYKDAFNADDDALAAMLDAHIIRMEKGLTDWAAHTGKIGYIIDTMKFAMENGMDYFTRENMVVYENAPTMLPHADWWGELGMSDFYYFTLDEDFTMIPVTVDSDLSLVPEVEMIYTYDVDKQDVIGYAAFLMDIGLEGSSLKGNEEDSEPWSISLRKGPIMLWLSWKSGRATVTNLCDAAMFAPIWYASLAKQE